MLPSTEILDRAFATALRRLPAHPRVTELRYFVDLDPQGQEALVVYVILADEDATPIPPQEALLAIEETLSAAIAEVSDVWVYCRFRSSSEQRAEEARRGVQLVTRQVSAA